MNLADCLHADSDAIIFGWTGNPSLNLWFLNVGGPIVASTVKVIMFKR